MGATLLASLCLAASLAPSPTGPTPRTAPQGVIPASSSADDPFDFESEARGYLETVGLTAEGLTFREFLDGPAFARIELGAFDLRLPVSTLGDKVLAERLCESAATLVELQRVWTGWTHGDDALVADWKTVGKWVGGWSARKLGGAKGGATSLFETLDANAKVLDAAARLSEAMRYPTATADLVGNKNVTVLAPDRATQVRIAAVGGLLDESKREVLWHPATVGQGAAWFDWIQIIGLENTGGVDWARPFDGVPYDEMEETGLAQHVADRGGVILLRKEFCQQGTELFEQALAANLVLETVGKYGVRSADWDLRYKTTGSKTDPYSRFVPGGNPSGGTLPPRKAAPGPKIYTNLGSSGHYREDEGEDFYVEILKDGQKAGAKRAAKVGEGPLRKDARPHFELLSPDDPSGTYVTAPFLGAAAGGKALPPNAFLDDYEDFFLAYRSCFLRWLRTKGAGTADASAERFAELLRKHATRDVEVTLDAVIQEVYGVPLSDANDATDSMEWRFLSWLPKAR